MTKGETDSITYIALGTDTDKVKTFMLRLNDKINEYNWMIKNHKKCINKESKSDIKKQIKEATKEFRSIKYRYIFNDNFPNFCDIKDINHVVFHMLIIEKLIGEITEEARQKFSGYNEYKKYIEENIYNINIKCSDAFEKAEESLINEGRLKQLAEKSSTKEKGASQLYDQAYVYLKGIRHQINSKMENLKEEYEIDSKTYEYLSSYFEESKFWIKQMENWKETVLKQAIRDLN